MLNKHFAEKEMHYAVSQHFHHQHLLWLELLILNLKLINFYLYNYLTNLNIVKT